MTDKWQVDSIEQKCNQLLGALALAVPSCQIENREIDTQTVYGVIDRLVEEEFDKKDWTRAKRYMKDMVKIFEGYKK